MAGAAGLQGHDVILREVAPVASSGACSMTSFRVGP